MPDDRDTSAASFEDRNEVFDGGAVVERHVSHASTAAQARGWFEAAQDELPLALSFEAFAGAVAEHEPVAEHATEFYLATACRLGVDGAPEHLLQRYGPAINAALGRMALPSGQREDAKARACEIVLVGEGSGPAIGRYRGRGSLAGWLKVATVRAAHRVLRGQVARTDSLEDSRGAVMTAVWSPQERALLDDEGAALFRETLREVLQGLDAEQRTMLRVHYGNRMSIDALAEMWGVHRATAARRIARLRGVIRDGVLTRLQGKLGTSPSSVGRWVRQMQSQLGGLSSLLDA